MSQTFANTIDGNDIYAKRAECDAAGNTLSTTYATKSELPGSSQLVPSATSADADKVLTVDSLGVPGWAIVPSQSTGLFQATYGTSTYNEVHAAVTANKIVYCYVSRRMAFLAYIGSDNYEFQYYRSNGSSSGADSVFVYKVTSEGWTTTERPVKAGNISYPVTQVNVNGSSAMTGTVANITVQAVPAVTSSDNNKVLKASYSGGTGSYSWQAESGGGGGSYSAGTGIDITAGTISVDTTTVAMKTDIPTVPTTDQTYNSSSTNPQSGTAVAGAISGVAQVPSVTSSDNAKVLTASYSGGVASYSWQTAQGGGGTSNVTTADKQINVAVNGTGIPMQLNLLNPVGVRSTVDLGHPSVRVGSAYDSYSQTTTYYLEFYWRVSKDSVYVAADSGYTDSNFIFRFDVSNDIKLIDGNDRADGYPTAENFTVSPNIGFYTEIRNASNGNVIGGGGTGVFLISGSPVGDVNIRTNTEELGRDYYTTYPTELAAATTLEISCGVALLTGAYTYMSQSDLEVYAEAISQNLSNISLTMNGNVSSYVSYIGSNCITGTTSTSQSSPSGTYRYDFSAAEKELLVPGNYVVQVTGPNGSGTYATSMYLYSGNKTGSNYYANNSKSSYLSSTGTRQETFLVQVQANTTGIATAKSGGQFTMVRIG